MNIIRANKFNKLFIRKNSTTEEKVHAFLDKTCNYWGWFILASTLGGSCIGFKEGLGAIKDNEYYEKRFSNHVINSLSVVYFTFCGGGIGFMFGILGPITIPVSVYSKITSE